MKVARWLGCLVLGQLLLLAASGVYLFFEYRPSSVLAWTNLPSSLETEVKVARVVRALHYLGSWLLLATLVALVVVLVADRQRRRRREIVSAGVMLVVGLVATFTGVLLPWDQLALLAVTVGTDLAGYRPLMRDDVRSVFIDGSEVAASTVLWFLAAHLLAGMVVVAGITALLVWMRAPSAGSAAAIRKAVATTPSDPARHRAHGGEAHALTGKSSLAYCGDAWETCSRRSLIPHAGRSSTS